ELQIAFDRASEAEAARRNEALKAALLDALTHNLRTPLTAIKAAVTAMIGSRGAGVSQLPEEDRRELLQVIDEESDRLNRFIEGLSSAAQPDTPPLPHLRAVALEDIVRAGLPIARRLVEAQAGQIWIEPANTRTGTTVVIILPAAVEAVERDMYAGAMGSK